MKTLSITMDDMLYDNLKHTVSSRKISKFVCEAVEEKLRRENEILYQAYREASQDMLREDEIKLWDDISHEDWETPGSST